MNTNLIHNVLNISIAVIAALAGFDWNVLSLDPALAAKIVAGLGTAKMVINVLRDGFSGLFKQQPPVV